MNKKIIEIIFFIKFPIRLWFINKFYIYFVHKTTYPLDWFNKKSPTNSVRFTLEQPKQENTSKLNESTNLNIATDPRPEIESNYDALTTFGEDNKRIPIPEHVEPEPKKRGLLGRLARAVFTDE